MLSKPFCLSVKIVVRDDQGRCLLLRRAPAARTNVGRWDFPGGKIDPGENINQALEREIAEETRLVVEFERIAGSAQRDLPERLVAYLFVEGRLISGDLQLSEEHDDYRWVAPEEIASLDLPEQFQSFAHDYPKACAAREAEGDR